MIYANNNILEQLESAECIYGNNKTSSCPLPKHKDDQDESDDDWAPKCGISAEDKFGHQQEGNNLLLDAPLKLNETQKEGEINIGINIDKELNNDSENPVQNKVVNEKINKKLNNDSFLSYYDINNIIYDVFGF